VKVSGSVQTLYKIAKAGGSIEGQAKDQIQNLQAGAPASEQDPIKLRVLYLFCGMVANATDIPTERKVQLFEEMNKIKEEPKPAAGAKLASAAVPAPAKPKPKSAFAIDGTYASRNNNPVHMNGTSDCNYTKFSAWLVTKKGNEPILMREVDYSMVGSSTLDKCPTWGYHCYSILRMIPMATSSGAQPDFSFETVGSVQARDRSTGLQISTTGSYYDGQGGGPAICPSYVPTAGFKGRLVRLSPLQLSLTSPSFQGEIVLTRDEESNDAPQGRQLPK
jgi:hypothetical protein